MKTTVEIADGLLAEARQTARAQQLTLRELIEDGLRMAVEKKRQPAKPFKLKDGSYGHGGMTKDFTWPELRTLIYGELGDGPGK